jgi:acetylornithine deacetylase/succinyl-diaminopimelate desuccinylase-like protein
MQVRHDPLPGAAELVLAAEQAARHAGHDAVATVGTLAVHPGASNSIPRQVRLSLDARAVDNATRDGIVQSLVQAAQEIAGRRGLAHTFQIVNSDPALQCAAPIVSTIEAAAAALALPTTRVLSRAYHDTVFMGTICPVGMIFIPCRHGYSHRPEEYASPEHIAAGVQVLALALAKLADGPRS